MAGLKIFEQIHANLENLSIDEIRALLAPLTKGMRVESPIFDPGTFLYRARKVNSTFNKSVGIELGDLIYPPKPLSKLGRLNRDGAPVFYCSMNKESVFFELSDLNTNDELILTFWQTTERMLVNNIGYTRFVFERLGAKRDCPQWHSGAAKPNANKETMGLCGISQSELNAVLSHDENSELRRVLSEHFMCVVGPTEVCKYKLTTAIGELHLGKITNQGVEFAGVLYPSARMWANGDNLALLPWFVDDHLKFKKALHIRIDSRDNNTFSITDLDSANKFGEDRKLIWLGRIPNWTLQPMQKVQAIVTPGRDDDGDYQMAKDGTPCYWVVKDVSTGQIIQPQ